MANHSTDKQPEPALTRAGIVTALTILAALLVHFGAPSAGSWLTAHSDIISGLILAVGTPVSGWLIRNVVTPLESPTDAVGRKLVAIGSAPATLDAAKALAEAAAIFPEPDTDATITEAAA